MEAIAQGQELAGQAEFDQLHAVTAHNKSRLKDNPKRDHNWPGVPVYHRSRFRSMKRGIETHESRFADAHAGVTAGG